MAIHSKLTSVKVDTYLGVLTNISAYCNKFSIKRKLDNKDVTTFGAAYRSFLPGFSDATISAGGPWTRASDNFWAPIFAAFEAGSLASLSFQYGPEGADAADTYYYGEMIMEDDDAAESDVDNPVMWSATFRVTGGVSVGTY